jgi:hypothetical protein
MSTLTRILRQRFPAFALLAAVAMLGLTGCPKNAATPPKESHDDHDHAHDHDHAAKGPRGGQILEFGSEERHAELTHDEKTHKIGVFMLGSDAKTGLAVDAKSATINVAIDGQPHQYELPATTPPAGADDKASYFEVTSEPLCKLICGELDVAKARAELRITIGGVSYTAPIEIEAHGHSH